MESHQYESVAAEALQAGVLQSLNWCLFDNATFLAERLHAEVSDARSLYLLATCYYRSGQTTRAYSILKGQNDLDCRYLFARTCLDLDKLQEGELALTGALYPGNVTDISDFHNSYGAAYALLGDICMRAHREKQAAECYRKSITSSPFLWSSFEKLCQMGEELDVDEVFNPANASGLLDSMTSNQSFGTKEKTDYEIPSTPRTYTYKTPKAESAVSVQLRPELDVPVSLTTPATPVIGSFTLAGGTAVIPTASSLGSPMPLSFNTPVQPAPGNLASLPSTPPPQQQTRGKRGGARTRTAAVGGAESSPPVLRRSVRLFSSGKGKTPARESKRKTAITIKEEDAKGTQESENSGQESTHADQEASSDKSTMESSIASALNLLKHLGKALISQAFFNCREAVSILNDLAPKHFYTGWVQCMIGKAHFELNDYKQADDAYRMARRVEPHRVDGMELYSTVLWHLRRETALSYLAHEVVAANRLSPQAWCVVGNCFSLQKEHDAAIKFFERAVQVDPRFTYAHTLLGHEYIYNEDYGKAMVSFRNAIQNDSRHYNAWYGMGTIYYRQEKYDLAEYHFLKASEINKTSPILLCYLAMVRHALKRTSQALEAIEAALAMDSSIPLVKFNKAKILFSLGRNQEALDELQELKLLAPQESSIYFLMGRIYKKMNMQDKALIHFTWAINVDPKDPNNKLTKENLEDDIDLPGETDDANPPEHDEEHSLQEEGPLDSSV
eukprot:m.50940 g.50940  ORF g.50940 m.50940 type:complete len:730 (+) comp10694_c0_seq1:232-2421(+)